MTTTTPAAPLVAVVQPAASCPPGRVGAWLAAAGCRLQVVHAAAGEPVPTALDGFAGLVVLGGEMGADDDATHPWLTPTKTLLARAVAEEVPTLAICLGLQLLAVAAGGRVTRADDPQLGVRPVELTAAGRQDPLFVGLPEPLTAVHWNDDLVTGLPAGAEVLARSAGTVQALRLGTRAWGVQFHPELDPATLARWAEDDVAAGRLSRPTVVQRLAEVEAGDAASARTWRTVTDRFAALVMGLPLLG